MGDFDMHNGIRPSECTCVMTRPPKGWQSYNGPEPAEWEQDPLCFEHPAEPGTFTDPVQSAPIGWVERVRAWSSWDEEVSF